VSSRSSDRGAACRPMVPSVASNCVSMLAQTYLIRRGYAACGYCCQRRAGDV
jgi:hypothetical protein